MDNAAILIMTPRSCQMKDTIRIAADNGLDWTHSYHLTCRYATNILAYELYLG
jgi:hypothetical protein